MIVVCSVASTSVVQFIFDWKYHTVHWCTGERELDDGSDGKINGDRMKRNHVNEIIILFIIVFH